LFKFFKNVSKLLFFSNSGTAFIVSYGIIFMCDL
jgi:hypothetical protein